MGIDARVDGSAGDIELLRNILGGVALVVQVLQERVLIPSRHLLKDAPVDFFLNTIEESKHFWHH